MKLESNLSPNDPTPAELQQAYRAKGIKGVNELLRHLEEGQLISLAVEIDNWGGKSKDIPFMESNRDALAEFPNTEEGVSQINAMIEHTRKECAEFEKIMERVCWYRDHDIRFKGDEDS